jgi:hypothetical protein
MCSRKTRFFLILVLKELKFLINYLLCRILESYVDVPLIAAASDKILCIRLLLTIGIELELASFSLFVLCNT